MLEVRDLSVKYGELNVVDGLSFSVSEGQWLMIVGPNGAGKSTVIKSVLGLLRYSGTVRVDGLFNKTVEAKRLLGYVPEIPALYPNLTVREHLEFVARAYRLRDYQSYADELLERMELSDKKKKFGDELSKGMRQKLGICCGLLPRPRVILFDEPMIGLDPHAIKELKTMIGELRDEGRILMVSTHMIDSVDMLWDRTLIMQKGVIRADVTRETLEREGHTLEQLFFDITEGSESGGEAE
jgi:ABC-type multidrug transport system ATPase subunit